MTQHSSNEAYDLSLHNMPALKPPRIPQYNTPIQQPKSTSNIPKALIQIRRTSLFCALHALRLIIASTILIALFCSILSFKISLIQYEQEAAAIKSQISEAQSEKTRLIMQLNSSSSRDKVDAFAISVLGMHKLEQYQIHYLGSDGGDKVAVVNGKTVKDKPKTNN